MVELGRGRGARNGHRIPALRHVAAAPPSVEALGPVHGGTMVSSASQHVIILAVRVGRNAARAAQQQAHDPWLARLLLLLVGRDRRSSLNHGGIHDRTQTCHMHWRHRLELRHAFANDSSTLTGRQRPNTILLVLLVFLLRNSSGDNSSSSSSGSGGGHRQAKIHIDLGIGHIDGRCCGRHNNRARHDGFGRHGHGRRTRCCCGGWCRNCGRRVQWRGCSANCVHASLRRSRDADAASGRSCERGGRRTLA